MIQSMALMAGALLVAAQAGPAPVDEAKASNRKASDPNEIVCEKQEVLGSRLATKKVCMTRGEWAEQRRLDRQELEKAQVNRGTRGN